MKYITVKTGCQMLECRNGGLCDGHDPKNPVCFCLKGFSGRNCEIGNTNFVVLSTLLYFTISVKFLLLYIIPHVYIVFDLKVNVYIYI